ncbi:MAG: hypothetical protein RL283_1567 [Actinomycetota bacterium]|jgi:polyisoprenoid-binding protein YceI
MRRVALGAVAVAAALVVGPWIYINVVRDEAPAALDLPATSVAVEPTDAPGATAAPTTTTAPADPSGTWVAAAGSVAGYRVDEVLFGQRVTAVGRTSGVTGEITIDGGALRAAAFTVDLTTVASDNAKRDSQFANRIMDVLNHPTATFALTEPVEIGSAALAGAELATAATGELTLRGTTRPVVVDLRARLAGSTIEVSATTEIVFADWGIPDPSLPGIRTEDRGILEVLLVLGRA